MPETINTDLVVLGGGPGGYAAAFLAAERGVQTTLLDANAKPGGTCMHVGCIPSKTLLHVADLIHLGHEAAEFGIAYGKPEIDLAKLRAKGDKIVDMMSTSLLKGCKDRKVNHIVGRGDFKDPHTIEVAPLTPGPSPGGRGVTITFKRCIIAVGSIPAKLPTFDIGSPRILDSTSALRLESVPKTLLVVGGGYIGLELGSVYAALGSSVTVVEMTASLLPGVDADLVRPLFARLRAQFDKIHLETKVTEVEEVKDGIKARLEPSSPLPPGEESGVRGEFAVFEKVLVAVGRRPNTATCGLDKAGVEVERGFIKTDKQRRTNVPHIFAIGDAAGEPMLAHKAAHEGKLVVEVLTDEAHAEWDPRAMPAVVFTDPEIAWCGLTETDAKKQNRPVKVGVFRWGFSGRATTVGRNDGLTKVLVDPATDQVLGVGVVGAGAGELIAEAVVAIEMGATAKDLAMCIHPHPTLSETIGEAAEFLHGLSSHIFVPRK
ncbi:MAG: dihydrolipoyl dehydrogenase [Planctomycetes bacterium]|nr:dihydrolipoyl dehydrogenase [Planctomycetota bacterium]